jgi:hypothetical protein
MNKFSLIHNLEWIVKHRVNSKPEKYLSESKKWLPYPTRSNQVPGYANCHSYMRSAIALSSVNKQVATSKTTESRHAEIDLKEGDYI